MPLLTIKVNRREYKVEVEATTSGACSVLVDNRLRRACLTNALSVQGAEVTTVEGLGEPGDLHPVQKQFYENFASQCGYCTPGMIMASKALLDRNPNPTDQEVKEALSGNLCRCTGYVNIIKAVRAAAQQMARCGGDQ